MGSEMCIRDSYYTPNGRSIQAEGIVPDIVVERAEVTSVELNRRTKEADLQGSLSGDGGPVDAQSESEALTELRNSDNQLYEALTLLRGINLLTPEAPAKVSEEKNPATAALGTPFITACTQIAMLGCFIEPQGQRQ